MTIAHPPFAHPFCGGSPEHLLALPSDGVLDPVLFGVLTAAVEEEAAEAYRAGFTDGLRTASLRPDLGSDDEAGTEDSFTGSSDAEKPFQP